MTLPRFWLRLAPWLVAVLAALSALVSASPVDGAGSASQASGLIAFTRADGIYVMRADGSGVRPVRRGGVAAHAFDLAWSPASLRRLRRGGGPP